MSVRNSAYKSCAVARDGRSEGLWGALRPSRKCSDPPRKLRSTCEQKYRASCAEKQSIASLRREAKYCLFAQLARKLYPAEREIRSCLAAQARRHAVPSLGLERTLLAQERSRVSLNPWTHTVRKRCRDCTQETPKNSSRHKVIAIVIFDRRRRLDGAEVQIASYFQLFDDSELGHGMVARIVKRTM